MARRSMGGELGILVVGAGKIGRMHAANVAGRIPHVRLAAICDVDPTVRQQAAAEFTVPTYNSVEQALLQPDVAAVLVASTAQTHAEIIAAAVAAGKHIFAE